MSGERRIEHDVRAGRHWACQDVAFPTCRARRSNGEGKRRTEHLLCCFLLTASLGSGRRGGLGAGGIGLDDDDDGGNGGAQRQSWRLIGDVFRPGRTWEGGLDAGLTFRGM